MVTDTTRFARGLADSAAMVKGFQRSATTDFAASNKLLRAGLTHISDGLQGVGIVAANAMRTTAGAIARAAPKILSSLGPIGDAIRASGGALAYTYGGAAKGIGGGLAKMAGPLVAAAQASASSLSYVYGPAIKAIGAGLSSAFAAATKAMMPLAASLGTVAVGLGKVAGAAMLAGRGMLKLAAVGAVQIVGAFKGLTGAVGIAIAALRSAVNQLGLFAAAAGGVAALGIWKVAKGAMALGEQTDAARVIFGDFTDSVVSRSKLMATAFGVSRKSYLQSAQAFGTIFEGAGYAEKDAATIANHMMKLAADTSSLKHLNIQEVMEKMQSGLQGNIKPLRELGVSMAEVDVQAYAAKNKIAELGHEMTESQKIQARLGLMTERLAKANDNLAMTYGSPANQVRSLTGRIENLSDTVGTAINTILGPAISELTVGVQALQMAWDASALAAMSASVGVVGSAQGQTEAIGVVQQAIGKIADVWQTVGLAFLYVQEKVTEGLIWMVENLDNFASGIGKIVSYFTGIQVASSDFTKTWLEDLKRMQAAQEETFTKELAKPAASENINAAFAAARAQIAAAQQEVKRTTPSIAGLKPKTEEPLKGKEVKFASAMTRGSSEAASTILRSRFGGGKTNDELKKQTANTSKANEHLSKIAGALTGGGIGTLSVMETL